MVDIHCHLLPGADDGAASWKIASDMCRMAAQDGIEHIVATPHANHQYLPDRCTLAALLDQLRNMAGERLQLSLGYDFHLSFENVEKLLEMPEQFVIGETRYLLLELSDYAVSPNLHVTLHRLSCAGLCPIITHPERNPILQHNPQWLVPWIDAGCLVQVTASSLTGNWGARALRTAKWLLKQNAVHVLATDAHNTRSRPPVLSEARRLVARWLGEETAEALVNVNPRAIVSGQLLPYFPEPIWQC
jgi:protein-tyrosine phosphatase